ncbi:hypothetical protein DLE01_38850, partial [Streptomyces sp. FT05W]
SMSDPASADALSKYENSGAHGIDPLSGTHTVSSGWDGRLIMSHPFPYVAAGVHTCTSSRASPSATCAARIPSTRSPAST